MGEKAIRTTLRMMAWERARGELYSILQTYYPGDFGVDVPGPAPQFLAVKATIETFIAEFEDNHC